MDALANRYAHWADSAGLRRGDVVALLMPNRLDYLPIWYGLSKVGVVAALINNQLTGEALAHCLNVSGAGHCLVDEETGAAFEAAKPGVTQPIQAWTLGERQRRPARPGAGAEAAARSCGPTAPAARG